MTEDSIQWRVYRATRPDVALVVAELIVPRSHIFYRWRVKADHLRNIHLGSQLTTFVETQRFDECLRYRIEGVLEHAGTVHGTVKAFHWFAKQVASTTEEDWIDFCDLSLSETLYARPPKFTPSYIKHYHRYLKQRIRYLESRVAELKQKAGSNR